MAENSSQYSTSYLLIEARLKAQNIEFTEFIAARRPTVSWRSIATEIKTLTEVSIGHEILRRWFADRISYAVTVA